MPRRSLVSQLFWVNTIPEINEELNCTKKDAIAALANLSKIEVSKNVLITRSNDTLFRIEKKGFFNNSVKTFLEGEIIERNGRALINAKYRYYICFYMLIPILMGLLIIGIIYSIFSGMQLLFILTTSFTVLTILSIIAVVPVFIIFQVIGLYFDKPRREMMYKGLLSLKESLEE